MKYRAHLSVHCADHGVAPREGNNYVTAQSLLDVTDNNHLLATLCNTWGSAAQRTDDQQFLYEIPVATGVIEATRQLVELQNLRSRIHR